MMVELCTPLLRRVERARQWGKSVMLDPILPGDASVQRPSATPVPGPSRRRFDEALAQAEQRPEPAARPTPRLERNDSAAAPSPGPGSRTSQLRNDTPGDAAMRARGTQDPPLRDEATPPVDGTGPVTTSDGDPATNALERTEGNDEAEVIAVEMADPVAAPAGDATILSGDVAEPALAPAPTQELAQPVEADVSAPASEPEAASQGPDPRNELAVMAENPARTLVAAPASAGLAALPATPAKAEFPAASGLAAIPDGTGTAALAASQGVAPLPASSAIVGDDRSPGAVSTDAPIGVESGAAAAGKSEPMPHEAMAEVATDPVAGLALPGPGGTDAAVAPPPETATPPASVPSDKAVAPVSDDTAVASNQRTGSPSPVPPDALPSAAEKTSRADTVTPGLVSTTVGASKAALVEPTQPTQPASASAANGVAAGQAPGQAATILTDAEPEKPLPAAPTAPTTDRMAAEPRPAAAGVVPVQVLQSAPGQSNGSREAVEPPPEPTAAQAEPAAAETKPPAGQPHGLVTADAQPAAPPEGAKSIPGTVSSQTSTTGGDGPHGAEGAKGNPSATEDGAASVAPAGQRASATGKTEPKLEQVPGEVVANAPATHEAPAAAAAAEPPQRDVAVASIRAEAKEANAGRNEMARETARQADSALAEASGPPTGDTDQGSEQMPGDQEQGGTPPGARQATAAADLAAPGRGAQPFSVGLGQSVSLDPSALVNQASAAGRAAPAGAVAASLARFGSMRSPAQQAVPMVVGLATGPGGALSLTLEPKALGRIEVTVSRDEAGHTSIEVRADRTETLGLLMRDGAVLERALDDAGMNAENRSLSFDLSQSGSDRERREEHGSGRMAEARADAIDATTPAAWTRSARGLLDLQV